MKFLSFDGDRLPALGLGTYELVGDDCRKAVRDALALGYRHLDTAEMYDNEDQVGAGIADAGVPRDEIFLTTKVWRENLRAPLVARSLEASLRRLRTDYVDLLLIHWPNPEVPLTATLGTMMELKAAGLVRHVGVSNFPPPLFAEAAELAPVVCDQVEYHPFLAQDELLAAVRGRGAFLTAYSPLAQGKVLKDPTLQAIGREHGKNPAQVALRWLLEQGSVAAIPRSSSAEHRASNFDVFDFELSPEEMTRINGLARGERLIDPDFAPDWEMAAA